MNRAWMAAAMLAGLAMAGQAESRRPQLDALVGTHVSMPEFPGNVLAHELTHALEGVARHSSEGLMKAKWSPGDYAGMVYGPLAFAAEDLDLLRAHFKPEMSPGPTLVAAR